MTEHHPPRLGRPRDPAIESKVILAAQRVYTLAGMSGFTFEAIAREAGVGKPAIYRRWASASALMDDVLTSHRLIPEGPLQGGIREQLEELALRTMRLVHSEEGAFIMRLAAERQQEPGLFERYFARLRDVIHFQNRAMVVEAIGRGELAPTCDADALIQSVTGAVFVGALLGFSVSPDVDAPAAGAQSQRLVEQILRGAVPDPTV